MTPHEKAVSAINARLERLQANLREAKSENAQRFLLQALVVTIALAEALNDYIKMVGKYAERRHGELKQANEALGVEHANWLKSGQELLERLKANPTDQAIRKEIESVQRNMASLQKTLRRGVNGLQQELAPGLASIDEMAVSVRRFSEAEQRETLLRLLTTVVEQVRDFYATQSGLPVRDVVAAEAWKKSAQAEIEQTMDFYDSYARTGYQATLALELMTMALSENPPQNAGDASERANAAVAVRIKEITARFSAP